MTFRLRSLPVSVLVLLAALLAAPAAASAAADPVLVAIASATKSKGITLAEARRHRATWLAAGSAARRAPNAARRREVQAVRTYTSNLARRRQLTADRLEPVLLSVKATTYVMRYGRSFPRHEQVVTMPGELAVFKYYSGRGVQWQPFESFKLGMQYVNVPVPETQQAREYAERMLELAIPRNGALTWEYYFPFGGPATPWTSSLSQSLATEFFHRTATQLQLASTYPEHEYIEDDAPAITADEITRIRTGASGALRSFQLPPARGGVSVAEGSGRWYLIYPFAARQRILNGHLQVLVNVSRYATDSASPDAAAVVAAGVRSVLPLMARFDTGGWSRYQFGQEADLNYHDFQTSQLKKLGAKSSTVPEREAFQTWYDRFSDYRVTAPEITVAMTPPSPIIPVVDGFRDTATLSWQTDKRSRDTVSITAADGRSVRRLVVQGGAGTHRVTWNGRDSRGRAVPAGTYSVSMDSVDIVGNRRRTDFTQTMLVLADTAPPSARSFVLAARGAKATVVRVAAYDTGSGWIDATVEAGGRVVARTRGGRAGSISVVVPHPLAKVRRMTLKLRDSSGNTTVVPLAAPITAAPTVD